MRTYALSPETLRGLLRQTIWRFQGIVTLSFLLLGLYLALFARPVYLPTALPIILIVALVYFLVIFFQYRQQLRLLYSIRVELDGSGIIYREARQEQKRISRADITRVRELKDGFWIQSVDPDLSLFIPFGLARDGDEQVRKDITSWTIIEPPVRQGSMKQRTISWIAWLAILLILLLANSLWVLIPAGVVLLVAGFMFAKRAQYLQEIEPGDHRTSTLVYSFLIFMVVMKSCLLGMTIAFAR